MLDCFVFGDGPEANGDAGGASMLTDFSRPLGEVTLGEVLFCLTSMLSSECTDMANESQASAKTNKISK